MQISVLITPRINSCLISVCRSSFPGNTIICSDLVPAAFLQAVPLNWEEVKFFSLEGDFFANICCWLNWLWCSCGHCWAGCDIWAQNLVLAATTQKLTNAGDGCSTSMLCAGCLSPSFGGISRFWAFGTIRAGADGRAPGKGVQQLRELPMTNWKCFPCARGCQGNSSCPGQPRI